MSELKAISGHEIREDIDYNTRGIDPEDKEWRNYGKELCDTLYYRKTEADKVIAEKDSEIARLNAIRKVHVEAIESMEAGLLQDDKAIRHQKYKRCFIMYRYCSNKALYELDFKGNDVKWKWYSKWMHKWFKLAEKFKEAK